eukprot:249121-Chlamydomonas_euryale.AAC.3
MLRMQTPSSPLAAAHHPEAHGTTNPRASLAPQPRHHVGPSTAQLLSLLLLVRCRAASRRRFREEGGARSVVWRPGFRSAARAARSLRRPARSAWRVAARRAGPAVSRAVSATQ